MDFFCDITRYAYLHNALFACLLAGIACGIVGTYVVCRRTVFLAGGITHASFGGLGLAFYLGQNPILGAMVFAVLSALGIEWASARGRIREDSAIGIIWSVGMALGVLFMSLRPGYTSGDLAACLFGNIVTVTDADVAALGVLTLLLVLGALLWLETSGPDKEPIHKLMVAQDIGGAIKGAVRGDYFWGSGDDDILHKAGRMNTVGRYFVLIPKTEKK